VFFWGVDTRRRGGNRSGGDGDVGFDQPELLEAFEFGQP
jgi:hypothetical protein